MYLLLMTDKAVEHGHRKCVSVPIKHGDFQVCYVNVCPGASTWKCQHVPTLGGSNLLYLKFRRTRSPNESTEFDSDGNVDEAFVLLSQNC